VPRVRDEGGCEQEKEGMGKVWVEGLGDVGKTTVEDYRVRQGGDEWTVLGESG